MRVQEFISRDDYTCWCGAKTACVFCAQMFRNRFVVLSCAACGTHRILPKALTDQKDASRLYNETAHSRVAVADDRLEWSMPIILKRLNEVGVTFAPGIVVIDVGCAEGMLADRIRTAYGCEMIGVDVDALTLQKAKSRYPQVKFFQGLFQDLRHELPKADVVIACSILEHVIHPPDFLKELATLLKPNGSLFISTPNSDSIHYRLTRSWWRELLAIGEHIFLFDPESLRQVAGVSGLAVRQIGSDYDEILFSFNLKSPWDIGITIWAGYRSLIKLFCRSLPRGLRGDILYARLECDDHN
jgi:2-polyprenyl-3-methyl-5-hydroxy-6-metoxy-1,4-benzoquinol methylase